MRRKPKAFTLTKEWLLERGVTNVTEDGHIFKGDYELSQIKVCRKHPNGINKYYMFVQIYDPVIYRDFNRKNGQRIILVHRAIYAWYNGVCPDHMDINHIDGNSLNNQLSNLECISRKENLQKRKIQANQWFNEPRIYKDYEELVEYGKSIELIPWYDNQLPCGFNEFVEQYKQYPCKKTFVEDMKKEMKDYVDNFKRGV